ncbi:MAG: glycosyltransferase, partial [Bacteroidota bacterium]|nr:glycosyltransferase [Bacteroidota bacterium]
MLRTLIPKYHLSAVISDNRFGMWNEDIPSVYLTHQLTVSTGNWFADRLATRWHRHVIEKYDLCWVPDDPQKKLSGALGENIDLKTPVQYLGPLSRFSSQQSPTTSYDILLLLSGPEPQRTVWETLLLSQLT